jgi:hypothetical protein
LPKRVYNRAYATFRVIGDTLDPLLVTLALRMPPDDTHRSGEPRLKRTRKGLVTEYAPYRFGMWLMSSEHWVNSPRLHVHLQWLLDQLEPHAEALVALRADGAKTDFFCYSSGTVTEPPSLPRTVRERAAVLGITIEIDHYVLPAEQDA